MTPNSRPQPFTGATTFTRTLTAGAVQSIRLSGTWIHRAAPRDTQPASFPLATGESVRVAGRWFHGPRIGGTR